MVGKTVSHYKIIEKIDEGGMGVVYKAEDTRLKRTVALKFLPPELSSDKEAKKRFIREAQAASSLQHNNICNIHDIDEADDGRLFIVMDCYEGELLREKIARGPMKLEEAVDIAVQAAIGLSKAHEKGIVHRDIKPANLFITHDGIVKILDFGLAKLAGQVSFTRSDARLGTTAYMSPEQAKGDEVDFRTDIWSLGVVLYEMLTGQLPFKGEYEQAVLYSIVHEMPKPFTVFRSDIPQQLGFLVESCLEKEKTARPQSMSEMIRMLRTKRKTVLMSLATWRQLSRQHKIVFTVIALIAVVFVMRLFGLRIPLLTPSVQQEWRIGIIPFVDMTKQKEANDWPLLIQAMIVDQLTGMEEIRVVDPFSLNGLLRRSLLDVQFASKTDIYKIVQQMDVDLIIEGMINFTNTGYAIQCTMTDPIRREVKFSNLGNFRSDHDLPMTVQTISTAIMDYFHIKALASDKEKELRPWFKSRTKSLAALKAFIQASEFSFTMRPGAERYLREAIQFDSAFIAPRIWLLSGLVEKQKLQEAQKQYQILLKLEQTANPFERALIRWTGACLKQDLFAQAQALDEALYFSPKNNILLYLLGRVCYLRKDYRGAIEAIRPAVAMKWQFQPAYYLLGISFAESGQFKEAQDVLEQSLKIEPVYSSTYSVLAVLSLRDKDIDKFSRYADAYVKRETDAGTSLDSIYFTLGSDCSWLGLYSHAIDYYHRAIALRPDNALYHCSLGNDFLSNGLIDSAQAVYVHVLELDSTLFDAHRQLGLIFERKGEKAKALLHYEKYLIKDKTSTAAQEIQSRVLLLKP